MHTTWPEDVGRVARQQRIDLGLSQDDLARKANVTRQWISRFEQAKSDVSLLKAMKVLRELNLTIDIATRNISKSNEISIRMPGLSKILAEQLKVPALSHSVLAAMNDAVRSSVDNLRLSDSAAAALRQLSSTSLPRINMNPAEGSRAIAAGGSQPEGTASRDAGAGKQ